MDPYNKDIEVLLKKERVPAANMDLAHIEETRSQVGTLPARATSPRLCGQYQLIMDTCEEMRPQGENMSPILGTRLEQAEGGLERLLEYDNM